MSATDGTQQNASPAGEQSQADSQAGPFGSLPYDVGQRELNFPWTQHKQPFPTFDATVHKLFTNLCIS